MKTPEFHIVGAGLAGSEAAWQLLQLGAAVTLYEMRPQKKSAAHKSGNCAELVCSNTFKSTLEDSAPGQLKKEMQALGSLIVQAAYEARVPAGNALGVDRDVFAKCVSAKLKSQPKLTYVETEIDTLETEETLREKNQFWLVATGPLSSEKITAALATLSGNKDNLYFYDAIAPIIATDSLDLNACFVGDRYGEGEEGDYLNIPMNKEEYENFIDDVLSAEKMALHDFEKANYFEACLPIEVMAERGRETLRFGPMKPVGFTDPKTGRRPWAVIQLRKENLQASMYSLVGFQTKMKWPEQQRILSKIPALKNAEFLRFGSVHRNTYLCSPKVLCGDLSFQKNARLFLAGQITGVEGYTESAAMGLLAARAMWAKSVGESFVPPPKDTMLGALLNYVTQGGLGTFQPMNANLGLLPTIEKKKGVSKKDRRSLQCQGARQSFARYALENFSEQDKTIFANSSALSDAPPTSPPSISG